MIFISRASMRRQLRIIALDVLFTRLAWQTKVKIITENEKPKQMPAAFPARIQTLLSAARSPTSGMIHRSGDDLSFPGETCRASGRRVVLQNDPLRKETNP
ncbi:ABC-type antimicrobial peptide transport system ATPase subunit [Rhizobium leguminosarum]|uniref:hypothetical protein n=2 Tax=Rhizobium TaxID=379 RepID=UPI00161F2EF9|nr:hypothetical protein [Rhizobium leguminosarum]MBB5662681.1 ABC-type antimicrobial peptide transport system ATPase subunit [Rhizobium leguminosarum]